MTAANPAYPETHVTAAPAPGNAAAPDHRPCPPPTEKVPARHG